MSFLIQPLFEATLVTNAATTFYTALARTRIDAMSVINPSATVTYTFTLHWVPSGGAAATANKIVPARPILPGESWIVFPIIGQTLAVGDFIQALASTTNVLNLAASGMLMS